MGAAKQLPQKSGEVRLRSSFVTSREENIMRRALCLSLLPLLALPALASGELGDNGGWIGELPPSQGPVPLPANGQWYYSTAHEKSIGPDDLDGWMNLPAQSDLWIVNSPRQLWIEITDLYITGDRYEVYVDGVLRLATPAKNVGMQPEIAPDADGCACRYEDQSAPAQAFTAQRYSSGAILVGRGAHTINVKNIEFAPSSTGSGFALRARPLRGGWIPVPGPEEPVGELSSPTGKPRSAFSVVPNPASGGRARVFLRLPGGESAGELVVYDIAGRRVARLAPAGGGALDSDAEWDGLDDDGREVAPGVYFFRLIAGDYTETQRVIVVR
jgi:hypothetical protein